MIQIQLFGHEEELSIIVEDDGSGFDLALLTNSSGNGWKNIRSRLNLIKSSIEIDSRAGMNGTTVTITVPLTRSELLAREDQQQLEFKSPETVAPNTQ